jgi:hypothetical protein
MSEKEERNERHEVPAFCLKSSLESGAARKWLS